ncbi:hypothetical protein BP5796_01657 [Coleophoma crateriformis]|uniref:Major facilitator superfamily (MFS) profile domain-containing protein n=1 Tax=Coleophoma crateriformis TaxID=565419 RepID=A0A3D8T126_9HELO|nr:hypothetical protein BP5796_01657 [Coleophoma crateriformis]
MDIERTEPANTTGISYTAAPGTEILIDENQNGYIHTLQHAKIGDGNILLVPQPSLTDPNDPLRWPKWKKWMVFINGLFYSFLGSIIGPIMSGGMQGQSAFFGVPITKLSWAAGISLLFSGVATLFWIPLSVKYGRRPIYLITSFTMGVGCIWCGVTAKTTFASFFVARAFAGFFAGPIEAIVPNVVTDVFFLHDRGEKIAIYGLSVLGGNELGPVFSAYIIQGMSMSWAFYLLGMGLFLSFVLVIFFMPETAYFGVRPVISLTAPEVDSTDEKTSATTSQGIVAAIEESAIDVPRTTYFETLKPWGIVNPHVSLKKCFLRPFVLLAYPTILWASLVYGMSLAWNVILALTIAQLFAPPPYSFNSGAQGLIFLSPMIGSLVGTYVCGPLADKIAIQATRRNNGIREPEMRLPIATVAAFLTIAGVAIAGPCYADKTHWIGPIFGFGVLSIGAQIGCNLSMTYALDSHKELSGELMITISVTKSLIAWAWSWFINSWIDLNGMMDVYFTGESCKLLVDGLLTLKAAVINLVVYASTAIFYYRGLD